MKKTILMFIIMQYAALHTFSQNKINGIVKNAEGDGVEFINVIASPANAPKTILASAFTDENGKFQIWVQSECDSVILKASSVDIQPTQIKVANRTGNYEIIVENRAAELKEVIVK
ncbi:MAG: carboxypeptidase-like regulatory domain-containing protein, partial [Muribaculaceae bacterium]|nr:carboxypeptidase-like regulatory domain-containing protein [Muribaculaceae bacterium]